MNETTQPAVAGPVEPTVRPLVAWLTEGGCEALQNGEGPVRAMPAESEETGFTVPFYAAHADDVLEALDLPAESYRTEGGAINRAKLRAALLQPEEYLPPEHWLRVNQAAPPPPPA